VPRVNRQTREENGRLPVLVVKKPMCGERAYSAGRGDRLTIFLHRDYSAIANAQKAQFVTNILLAIFDVLARRQAPRPNAHIAELREVFALACHFGPTNAERNEWQARFDAAVAGLEADIAASERSHAARLTRW